MCLVLVDRPAFALLVPSFVTFALLDYLVDGQMLEARGFGKELAVAGLAHAGRASDDDIRISTHGVWGILRRSEKV
jgi:hypothetical protein